MMNPYSTELCHHGILGQKWGVRRFQNADGSLTAAGRARYLDSSGSKLTDSAREHNKKALNDKNNYQFVVSENTKNNAKKYKELLNKWGDLEDEEDELTYKLLADKSIRKQAEEKAIKDGLKRDDPDFEYFVYGDTPSENYSYDIIYNHPKMVKLRNEATKYIDEADKYRKLVAEEALGNFWDKDLYSEDMNEYMRFVLKDI